MSTLSASHLAIARRMRDRGDSWRKISTHLPHTETTIRDALVAEGYVRDSRPRGRDSAELRRQAYQLYIVKGETLRATAKTLGIGHHKTRAWIIAEGGELRRQHDTRVHGIRKAWGMGVACAIGAVMTEERWPEPIGSYYCALDCELTDCRKDPVCGLFDAAVNMCASKGACEYRHDPCQDEVTPENRAGFAAFKARRAEHERKCEADPKQPRARVQAFEYQIKGGESDDEFCESSPS